MRILLLTPFGSEGTPGPGTRAVPKNHTVLTSHLGEQHDVLIGAHVVPNIEERKFDPASRLIIEACGGLSEEGVISFDPDLILVAGICGTGDTYWGEYLGAKAAGHNYMWRARKDFLTDLISGGTSAIFLLDNVTGSPTPWGASSSGDLSSEYDLLGGVFQGDLELVQLGNGWCGNCPAKPNHFYVSCHPERMLLDEEIRPSFETVDHVLAWKARPLFGLAGAANGSMDQLEMLGRMPDPPSPDSERTLTEWLTPLNWETRGTGKAAADLGTVIFELDLEAPASHAWSRETATLDPALRKWHRNGLLGFEPGFFVSGQAIGDGRTLFVSALVGSDHLVDLCPDNLEWISGLVRCFGQ